MSIFLSQIFKAAGLCVIISTVLSVIWRKFVRSCCSVASSSELVASSKIRMGRSDKIARAIQMRSIYPSDRPAPRSPSRVSTPCSKVITNSSAQAIFNACERRPSCCIASGSPKATTSRIVPLISWFPCGT